MSTSGYERWLREGLDDYLGLFQFVGAEQLQRGFSLEHRYDDEVRVAVIESLRYMLSAGWIALGEPKDDHLVPLALTVDEVIARVENAWGTAPHFNMGIWFALTSEGEATARALGDNPSA